MTLGRAAAAIVVAGTLALVACSGDDDGKRTEATTTTRSTPPTTTEPASDPAVGEAITGELTRLISPSEPETRQIDAEAACRSFLEQPDGECAIAGMAGGNALWTVEARPELIGADEHEWQLRVWTQSDTMPDGGWRVALQLPEGQDPARRPSFANVAVRSADLTGDGRPELLVGYRAGGTGQFESYDVITFEGGGEPRVAAHREQLHKGSVALDGASLVDYSADESSPACCPTSATKTTIAWQNGAFRIVDVVDVPIDQQPSDLFA